MLRQIHGVGEVEFVEKFGKWVVHLQFAPNGTMQRFWASDKQKRGLDRCMNAEARFAVIDVSQAPKERFVYASNDAAWLMSAFGAMLEEDLQAQPSVSDDELF